MMNLKYLIFKDQKYFSFYNILEKLFKVLYAVLSTFLFVLARNYCLNKKIDLLNQNYM